MLRLIIMSYVIFFSSYTYANCWNECLASVGGSCLARAKICNLQDIPNAIDSLDNDFERALNLAKDEFENARGEWKKLYHSFPKEVTSIIDRHGISLVGLFIPMANVQRFYIFAVEVMAKQSKKRRNLIDSILRSGPSFKVAIMRRASDLSERQDVQNIFLSKGSESEKMKSMDQNMVAYEEFVKCVEPTKDPREALACYGDYFDKTKTIKLP